MDTPTTLTLDFAGELHRLAPGDHFVIGRAGDLQIDDNPYLHRAFVQLSHMDGLWWVTNVGGRLAAHLTDRGGLVRTSLAPGARQPITAAESLLTFTAGSTTYEILLSQAAAAPGGTTIRGGGSGDTTIAPAHLTDAQKLAILALAEPLLRRAGTGASRVPSAVEAARRLGWAQTRFNRKLDNVCDKLERYGVMGLRGAPGGQTANRRVQLVEFAVSTLLVTTGDLPLLEAEARRNRGFAAKGALT